MEKVKNIEKVTKNFFKVEQSLKQKRRAAEEETEKLKKKLQRQLTNKMKILEGYDSNLEPKGK